MSLKLAVNIIITVLLLSCSEQKKEQSTNDEQPTIVAEVAQEDSIRTPIQKAEVVDVQVLKDSLKAHIDSVIIATKQVKQKHKEIPPDGEYIYDISYAEYQGQTMGEKVRVVIKGNYIKIISEGNPSMTAKKGDILDEGILRKHTKTGDWLVSNNPSDTYLDAYGDCVGIVMVIDFVNKIYHTC